MRITNEKRCVMDEHRTQVLAKALGGDAWNSGGGIWLAVVRRSDGRIVAVSDEAVCEYASEDDLLSGQPESSIFLVAGAPVSQT